MECKFCTSEVQSDATICANCGAEKGLSNSYWFGGKVVGAGTVISMGIVLSGVFLLIWIVSLIINPGFFGIILSPIGIMAIFTMWTSISALKRGPRWLRHKALGKK